MAILGIDFLRDFKLSMDPAAGKLVQDVYWPSFPVGQQLPPSFPQLILVLLARRATSAKEVFGTPLILIIFL
jgi:hypothetical protein